MPSWRGSSGWGCGVSPATHGAKKGQNALLGTSPQLWNSSMRFPHPRDLGCNDWSDAWNPRGRNFSLALQPPLNLLIMTTAPPAWGITEALSWKHLQSMSSIFRCSQPSLDWAVLLKPGSGLSAQHPAAGNEGGWGGGRPSPCPGKVLNLFQMEELRNEIPAWPHLGVVIKTHQFLLTRIRKRKAGQQHWATRARPAQKLSVPTAPKPPSDLQREEQTELLQEIWLAWVALVISTAAPRWSDDGCTFQEGSGQKEPSSSDRHTFYESHHSSTDGLIFNTFLPSHKIISGFLMEGLLNALISAFGRITRICVLGSPWRAHPFDTFLRPGYTATLNSPNQFSICPPFPLIRLSIYCAHLIYSSNFPSHFHIFDHKNLGKR